MNTQTLTRRFQTLSPVLALALALTFVSNSAHSQSASTGRALLEYTSTNATVSPQNRTSVQCGISTDSVTKLTIKANVRSRPVVSKVKWTAEVPSASAAAVLIAAAAKGNYAIGEGSPRVGAASEQYLAIERQPDDRVVRVTLREQGARESVNTSKAAYKLVRFIAYNCIQQ